MRGPTAVKWNSAVMLVVAAGCAVVARGQSPDAATASFEVASIKVSDPSHVGAQVFLPGPGRFTALTATLKDLIQFAYNIRPSQISGGPHWCESEAYDITAKTAGAPSSDQLHAMMRTLLEDRFQLKIRRETRELPVYFLVVTKRGPALPEAAAAGRGVGLQKRQLARLWCRFGTLAKVLSGHVDRLVIDQTGLKGFYNFALEWTADDSDPAGTSLLQALQEQLGLKLEAAKSPVEVLAIDRAERPSQN